MATSPSSISSILPSPIQKHGPVSRYGWRESAKVSMIFIFVTKCIRGGCHYAIIYRLFFTNLVLVVNQFAYMQTSTRTVVMKRGSHGELKDEVIKRYLDSSDIVLLLKS